MMEKPNLLNSKGLPYLSFQQKERYLPTAFDDSLTIIEKIDKIIHWLNQYSDLTDDMLVKWNEVYYWVMNEGLDNGIGDRLNEWLKDGTLSDLINDEIYRDVNDLMKRVETEIKALSEKLYAEIENFSSHVKDEYKHRNMYLSNNVDYQIYSNNDLVLSEKEYQDNSLILLDEVTLNGRIGGGNRLTISPEYIGRVKKYIIDFSGGAVREGSRNTAIVIRVNGDSENNYRSMYVKWSTNGTTDFHNRNNTNFPHVGLFGRYKSQFSINLMPSSMGNTGIITWNADGWVNRGAGSNNNHHGDLFKGGGRWSSKSTRIKYFTFRSNHSDDTWLNNSSVRMWGVL